MNGKCQGHWVHQTKAGLLGALSKKMFAQFNLAEQFAMKLAELSVTVYINHPG